MPSHQTVNASIMEALVDLRETALTERVNIWRYYRRAGWAPAACDVPAAIGFGNVIVPMSADPLEGDRVQLPSGAVLEVKGEIKILGIHRCALVNVVEVAAGNEH